MLRALTDDGDNTAPAKHDLRNVSDHSYTFSTAHARTAGDSFNTDDRNCATQRPFTTSAADKDASSPTATTSNEAQETAQHTTPDKAYTLTYGRELPR